MLSLRMFLLNALRVIQKDLAVLWYHVGLLEEVIMQHMVVTTALKEIYACIGTPRVCLF